MNGILSLISRLLVRGVVVGQVFTTSLGGGEGAALQKCILLCHHIALSRKAISYSLCK